jgi:hypothetical protein
LHRFVSYPSERGTSHLYPPQKSRGLCV